MDFKIEKMKSSDWDQISQIYKERIDTNNAIFETIILSWSSWISAHISGYNVITCKRDEIWAGQHYLQYLAGKSILEWLKSMSM